MVPSRTSSYIYVLPWFQAGHLHTSMCCCGSDQYLSIHLCVTMVLSRTSSYIYAFLWPFESSVPGWMCVCVWPCVGFGGLKSFPSCLIGCPAHPGPCLSFSIRSRFISAQTCEDLHISILIVRRLLAMWYLKIFWCIILLRLTKQRALLSGSNTGNTFRLSCSSK